MNLKHGNLKRVLLVAAVVCMLALFIVPVKAALELNSKNADPEIEVTVDGSMGANEWTDAYENVLPPFYFGADYGDSYVYIKNDEEFLYILCDQAFGSADNIHMDHIWIWLIGIDANNDDHLTPGVDMELISLFNATAEDPWIFIVSIANETYPLFELNCFCNLTYCNTTAIPGIAWSGTYDETSENFDYPHPIMELKLPLDLIGVNGTAGGTVGCIFVYLAQLGESIPYLNLSSQPDFALWDEEADDYPQPESATIAKWGDLVIPEYGAPPTDGDGDEEPPPGLPVWIYAAVAVVVIVVVVVAVFMLRRK